MARMQLDTSGGNQGRKKTSWSGSGGTFAKPKPKMNPSTPGRMALPPIKPASASPVKNVQPRQVSAPAPSARMGVGDFTGGTAIGGGGGAAMGAEMPEVPAQSDDDYLAGDSSYQATLAALMRALQDYDTDATAQKTKYGTDYNDAVKQLGWQQDDPATADVNEGAWNFNDLNTASGRAFNNQQNDFASRGLLQSSLYGTATDNLTRSLNDQLGSVNTAKTNFFDDLSRQQGSFKNENTLNQQQARAEALARRAAQFAI